MRRWRASRAAADARRRATSGDHRSRGPAPRPSTREAASPSATGAHHCSNGAPVTSRAATARSSASAAAPTTSTRHPADWRPRKRERPAARRRRRRRRRPDETWGAHQQASGRNYGPSPRQGSCESIAGLRFRDYNASQPHFPRQGRFVDALPVDGSPATARSPLRWRSARWPSPELAAQDDKNKDVKKASLSLKASPTIVFSPARVVVSAELKGGAEDNGELYCPSLEWDWGDGTRSESNTDCEPFEAGKTTIQRRFSSRTRSTSPGTIACSCGSSAGRRPCLAVM